MFQSRDEIRKVYASVWHKVISNDALDPMESVIAEVIKLHPEYHDLLTQKETVQHLEFTPEMGQSNPFLHMGMHIALREQHQINRPNGISDIYIGLCEKLGVHDAEHQMMECLAESLWTAQKNNQPPDEQAYIDCLKKL